MNGVNKEEHPKQFVPDCVVKVAQAVEKEISRFCETRLERSHVSRRTFFLGYTAWENIEDLDRSLGKLPLLQTELLQQKLSDFGLPNLHSFVENKVSDFESLPLNDNAWVEEWGDLVMWNFTVAGSLWRWKEPKEHVQKKSENRSTEPPKLGKLK